ncbi:hypothetical protein BDZ88DRAFT_418655 [Geranomyces variabilis]|nr:hypothetical protein BDZ88DRAFT_418655 [Geranomyces variabilis]KAJ3133378.1 hypothetical protein HDU90_006327 [Geranomyces variabilis]
MSRPFVSAERTTLHSLASHAASPSPSASPQHSAAHHLSLTATDIPLAGYQIHTNVDWVVNRDRLFKTFAVYTGRPDHVAVVSVAEFGAAGEDDRIRKAFGAFERDQLKMVDTGIGVLMIGNPEWFSKASSPCITVPDGDYDRHLPDLLVNINLRRLGCGERSLLSYRPPPQAVCDKFYRVTGIQATEETSLAACVLGLGALVHHALYLLALLPLDLIDGLMCDSTQAALQEFYNEFGPFDEVEAGSNWCDPGLLAALLRTMERLKFKLGVLGHPVRPGDHPTTALPRAIKHFQKAHGLKVTLVFDRKTVERIEALYARAPAPTQAVAAVSSTVNVLRTKIEDMTGLASAARRGDDSERDGPAQHLHTHGAIDHLDLDAFFAAWTRRNKRLEKIQGKKKHPTGSVTTVGSGQKMADALPVASLSNPTTLPQTHPPSAPEILHPQPVRPSQVALRSDSLHGRQGSPASPITGAATNVPPQAPGSPHMDDMDEDHVVRGLLRGLKDSTSRTIGGIVGKSKLVTKGMKHLANIPPQREQDPLSDETTSPLTPPLPDPEADGNGPGSAVDSGAEDRDTFDQGPVGNPHSTHHSSTTSVGGSLVAPIPVARGRTPPPTFFADVVAAAVATARKRRASTDSATRFRMNRATSPAPPPLVPLSAPRQPEASNPTVAITPDSEHLSSPPTGPLPPLPNQQPPPLHASILPLVSVVARRLKHFAATINSDIPPLLRTFEERTKAAAAAVEARAASVAEFERQTHEIAERQNRLEEAMERAENEAMRTKYAVGVAHERVAEAEEAVLGLMGRVKAVEGWVEKRRGQGRPRS